MLSDETPVQPEETILMVVNQDIDARTFKRMFSAEARKNGKNFEVTEVLKDALDRIADHVNRRISAVITDWTVGGEQVVAAAKAQGIQNICLMDATRTRTEQPRQDALRDSGVKILEKPVPPKDLFEAAGLPVPPSYLE